MRGLEGLLPLRRVLVGKDVGRSIQHQAYEWNHHEYLDSALRLGLLCEYRPDKSTTVHEPFVKWHPPTRTSVWRLSRPPTGLARLLTFCGLGFNLDAHL